MAQTPKSASVQYNSTTPALIYTVPAATTAVVKTLMAQSQVGTIDNVTVTKVSGGVTYPIVVDQVTSIANATQSVKGQNLLTGPITLAAGDTLSISTTTTAGYKFPQATLPTSTGFRISNLNYLNGNYIAVGRDVSLGLGLILTSSNGTIWTRQTFPFALVLTDIGFDGTNYVVVGTSNNGFLYRSTDLVTWTQQAAPNANNMHCVTYGNGKWVAGGVNGAIWQATTPTSWSAATLTVANTINTILTVGTNWAFGTTGAYTYTSDFVTYTQPNFFISPNRNTIASDAAGKLYICNQNSIQTTPATTFYTSTNQGKTFTATTLAGITTRPNSALIPFSFNNGARLLIPTNQNSANGNVYFYSGDGTTWTGTTNATYQGQDAYTTNMRPLTTASTYGIGTIYENNTFVTKLAPATGLLTNGFSFGIDGTYVRQPFSTGIFCAVGNGTGASWLAVGVDTADSGYLSYNWGPVLNSGSNGQWTQNAWSTSQGYPRAGFGTASEGFLIGTSSGRIMYAVNNNSPFNEIARPYTNDIIALVGNGTTLGSKIIALNSAGFSCFSVDAGVSWTTPIKVSGGFNYQSYQNNSCLTYGNGYWIALASNGGIYYTTDGTTWLSAPSNIQYSATLNSLNIFINGAGGVYYSTGTNIDVFTSTAASIDFSTSYPSVRRLNFVSGTYFLGSGNTIFSSTDLNVWSSANTNSLQINNTVYVNPTPTSSGATAAFAYSGSSTSFIMGSALRTTTVDNANISIPTVSSLSLVTGSVTAGIVEIN